MDIGTIERGIVIRIDGDGTLHYQHTPDLSPITVIGLLELTKQYAFHDLIMVEQKAADDAALIAALRKQSGDQVGVTP